MITPPVASSSFCSRFDNFDCEAINVSMVVPVLNAELEIANLLIRLLSQTRKPDEILIIDSASTDRTVEIARGFKGVQIIEIDRAAFNHGLTRDMAFKMSSGDIVCFMTQDAVPVDGLYVEKLIAPFFVNDSVAISTGRQLPKKSARRFEQLVREFNYPNESNVRSKADLSVLGIKTYFATDVCSAYRRDAYFELGGFERTDMSEDMLMAAKAINAGYSVAYAADACVYHSHNFTPREQYRRNYAVGRFLQEHADVVACESEVGEGSRLVKSVSKQLLHERNFSEFAAFGIDCCARLLGNRAGRRSVRKGE